MKGAVMSGIKKAVIILLRRMLSLLPNSVLGPLNDIIPRFFVIFPDNRAFLFRQYLGEYRVAIDTRYPIEREMLARIYEKKTYHTIRSYVKPGDWCLDVGANVGAVSLMLAQRVGAGGKVLAFEPGPLTFGRLRANLDLNPSVRTIVEIHNIAFSDKEGVLYWNQHENAPGNANLVYMPTESAVEVRVSTIDAYFSESPVDRLDFIKIDVESMEYEVIMGALGTIERFRPVIYYESLKVFEEYRKMPVFRLIQETLSRFGYMFYRCDENFSFAGAAYPDYSDNTLAVPGKKAMEQLGFGARAASDVRRKLS
jgi:FkbM family methyltransferase